MSVIKSLLLMCLVLTVAAAGTYVAAQRGLINLPALPNSWQESPQVTQTLEQASSQLRILGDRGQITTQESSKVLGEFIQVNEADNQKSTSEKALEYGRYLYCQQVVKDWEKRQ